MAFLRGFLDCLYSCRFCNHARANKPVKSAGKTLLDPTKKIWSEHFENEDDVAPRRTQKRDHAILFDVRRVDVERNETQLGSIARAVVHDTPVLILDETTTALDII